MRDHLSLHINGRPIRVAGDDAFLALADFLRTREHLTGTKVVCAEGDCGSCSVLIGRRDLPDAPLRYLPVTSCIVTMFQLDGTHVVTVEGLGSSHDPNPIQHAMADGHAAQCGFCTPGFVCTLYQMANDGVPMTRENASRAVVGNLCRCTGYDAILRAATQVDAEQVRPLATVYPDSAIGRRDQDDILIEVEAHRVYVPATLAQALAYRVDSPTAVVVAGGTDLGVLVNKRTRAWTSALAIHALPELRSIGQDGQSLRIGAASTLTELEREASTCIPPLGAFLSRFGSPPIRNAGTIGGNLATGSPIGDLLPALVVLAADIELASTRGTRTVPINAFYIGYRQSVIQPDELLTAITIPIPRPEQSLRLYKVSRRHDLDISTASAAILLTREGGTIADARIALGGVGPTVLRASAAEACLRGAAFGIDAFEAAADAVREAVRPIRDVRASADYRRSVAGNLLLRCYHDLIATGDEGVIA